MSGDRYIEGFLAGQAVAYCERVTTGMSLATQLVCPTAYADKLTELITQEHCMVHVEPHTDERTSLWIYRDELAKRLIVALQSSSSPDDLGMWGMGKLFGYADRDVLAFIERSAHIPKTARTEPTIASRDVAAEAHKEK